MWLDLTSSLITCLSAFQCRQINEAACRLAREVADEGDALVAGGITRCPVYVQGKGMAAVQAQIKQQLDVFVKNKVDFIIAEVSGCTRG